MTDPGGACLTRRRLLAGVAAGATGTLAGCSISQGDSVDTRRVLGHDFPYVTEQTQLNPWAAQYPVQFYTIIFEPLSVTTPAGGHRTTDLIDGIERDGSTVTVRYSDAYTWWSGEPVTAEDRWVADRIDALRPGSSAPPAELVDEYAIRYELDHPLDRQLAVARLADGVLSTARWAFDRWRQRLADATTDAAREAVAEDLSEWALKLEDAAEQGFGNGPYELTEVSVNRLILQPFSPHPRADELSVAKLWFPVSRGSRTDELVRDGVIDAGRGVLDRRELDPPDYIDQLATYRTANTRKLALNWDNTHLARRSVRRALVCALPIPGMVTNAGWGEPARLQTGLAAPVAERWLPEAFREQLVRYPLEADHERAAEFLRADGYSKAGGDWVDADGKPVTIRLRTPLWDRWLSTAHIVADALERFGFTVDILQTSNATFLELAKAGDYDALLWWSTGRPYSAYDADTYEASGLGYGGAGPGDEQSWREKPVRVTIPTDPGSFAVADGAGRELNVVEQWHRIRGPTTDRETAAATRLLARWWAHDLPDVTVATDVSGVWGNTRDFDWPDPATEAYRTVAAAGRPEYRLINTGAVTPARDGERESESENGTD